MLVSDAYVVVPGGIGTVLEASLVWQLLQVRHLHDTPLVFAGDMWAELIEPIADRGRGPSPDRGAD